MTRLVFVHVLVLAGRAVAGQPAVQAWWADSMDKLPKDALPPTDPHQRTATLELARNEHEAIQLVIRAQGRDLEHVGVEVGEREPCPGPTLAVRAHVVEYIKTTKPRYPVEWVGWWPDPLRPLRECTVPPGTTQPIWLDIYAPPGIRPGLHRLSATVRARGVPSHTLHLRVRVFDFTLPTEHHLKNLFSFSLAAYARFYGVPFDWKRTRFPPATRRALWGFLLERRVNPTNIYRPHDYVGIPDDEDLEWCAERGLSAFNIGRLAGDEAYGRFLRSYREFLVSKGLEDRAYIYGPDEIQYRADYPELRAEVIRCCDFVHRIWPTVPVVGCVDMDPELFNALDIFCPLIQRHNDGLAAQLLAADKPVWWYWCDYAERPGLYLDWPAIDCRIIPWMCFRYQVTGLVYYMLNYWNLNLPSSGGVRWPQAPWDPRTPGHPGVVTNGDGTLVYPGERFGELLSSVRLENLRDGMEDYEYLWLLQGLLERPGAVGDSAWQARALLRLEDSIIQDREHYSTSPEELRAVRRRAGEAIERAARDR